MIAYRCAVFGMPTMSNQILTNMYTTNYKVATTWLNNSYVLCNEIVNIDSESIWDNAEFEVYDEESESYREIFQFFITDCTEWDKTFLQEHFGLLFSYSTLLDKYILCVDHYGTSWDYVSCSTDLEAAQRSLGEGK